MRFLPDLRDVLLVGTATFFAVGRLVESTATAEDNMRVYIGTYTGGKSQGIYTAKFDSSKGVLSSPELAVKVKNPSFLALHPNGRVLYAVAETSDGAKGQGGVVAYRIDPGTGALTQLNEQPSGGGGPCHLSLDAKG